MSTNTECPQCGDFFTVCECEKQKLESRVKELQTKIGMMQGLFNAAMDRCETAETQVLKLEMLVRDAYPMVVDDVFGCGVEISDFQGWKRRAVQIVPPIQTKP